MRDLRWFLFVFSMVSGQNVVADNSIGFKNDDTIKSAEVSSTTLTATPLATLVSASTSTLSLSTVISLASTTSTTTTTTTTTANDIITSKTPLPLPVIITSSSQTTTSTRLSPVQIIVPAASLRVIEPSFSVSIPDVTTTKSTVSAQTTPTDTPRAAFASPSDITSNTSSANVPLTTSFPVRYISSNGSSSSSLSGAWVAVIILASVTILVLVLLLIKRWMEGRRATIEDYGHEGQEPDEWTATGFIDLKSVKLMDRFKRTSELFGRPTSVQPPSQTVHANAKSPLAEKKKSPLSNEIIDIDQRQADYFPGSKASRDSQLQSNDNRNIFSLRGSTFWKSNWSDNESGRSSSVFSFTSSV